jgi:hypothetical protein
MSMRVVMENSLFDCEPKDYLGKGAKSLLTTGYNYLFCVTDEARVNQSLWGQTIAKKLQEIMRASGSCKEFLDMLEQYRQDLSMLDQYREQYREDLQQQSRHAVPNLVGSSFFKTIIAIIFSLLLIIICAIIFFQWDSVQNSLKLLRSNTTTAIIFPLLLIIICVIIFFHWDSVQNSLKLLCRQDLHCDFAAGTIQDAFWFIIRCIRDAFWFIIRYIGSVFCAWVPWIIVLAGFIAIVTRSSLSDWVRWLRWIYGGYKWVVDWLDASKCYYNWDRQG